MSHNHHQKGEDPMYNVNPRIYSVCYTIVPP